MIKLTKEFNGRILDIGGGGEGIIGRLYTNQVIAIDISQEELDEAPEGFHKVLMDATDMNFSDDSFDHVTCFYSMMFMRSDDQKRAISEAVRVLKNDGELHIWDCDIVSAYPEPFCVDVIVQLPDQSVSATYGIIKPDTQSENSIIKICVNSGLTLVAKSNSSKGFYLCFKKQS